MPAGTQPPQGRGEGSIVCSMVPVVGRHGCGVIWASHENAITEELGDRTGWVSTIGGSEKAEEKRKHVKEAMLRESKGGKPRNSVSTPT